VADAWSDTATGADTSTAGITFSVSDGGVERRTRACPQGFRQTGNFGRQHATGEQQAFFAAASGTATATTSATGTATGTEWPSVEEAFSEGVGSPTTGAAGSDALEGRQNHFI